LHVGKGLLLLLDVRAGGDQRLLLLLEALVLLQHVLPAALPGGAVGVEPAGLLLQPALLPRQRSAALLASGRRERGAPDGCPRGSLVDDRAAGPAVQRQADRRQGVAGGRRGRRWMWFGHTGNLGRVGGPIPRSRAHGPGRRLDPIPRVFERWFSDQDGRESAA